MKTAIVFALLLTGCTSVPEGVQIDDEERAACAAQGCAVFTLDELQTLSERWYKKGFNAGKNSRELRL